MNIERINYWIRRCKKLFFILFFLSSPSYAAIHDYDANNLIEEIIQNYQLLDSYEDSGEIVVTFHKTDGSQHIKNISFKMYANDERDLRIQWIEHHSLLGPKVTLLLSTSCGIFSSAPYTNGEIREHEHLMNALSMYAGVSNGLTMYVPMLMFYPSLSFLKTNVHSATIEKNNINNMEKTYLLRIRSNRGPDESIWIKSKDRLIKKIEYERYIKRNKEQIRVTTKYTFNNIRVNQGIAKSVFYPDGTSCESL